MSTIYQSSFTITAHVLPNAELQAESIFLDDTEETLGLLRVDKATAQIREAAWRRYRMNGQPCPDGRTVTELTGLDSATIGKALWQALANDGEHAREVLAECVKGTLQAGIFLYKDRGFPTQDAYHELWTNKWLGTCRYFSNLHRANLAGSAHMGADERTSGYLFSRSKTVVLTRHADNSLSAVGAFTDTYHQMNVALTVENGIISQAIGSVLRAPNAVCFESEALLSGLIGKSLDDLPKKEAAMLLGGTNGCTHIIDITNEIVRAWGKLKPLTKHNARPRRAVSR